MARVYNFSAGPSCLPEDVLKKAAEEMLDYKGTGQSVMEMSHRSPEYEAIINDAEALLREVMEIPANYKVLFLQGGASSQFAMIPLNLFSKNRKADIVDTGTWSLKAIQETSRYGAVNVIATSKDKKYNYIPKLDPKTFDKDADFFHITTNNTIEGTVFAEYPDTGNVPLIADMSSEIMSRPVDVKKFGMIYAGAQKNIGPAGLTVVIIREDLIGRAMDICPTMFNYKIHAENGSMYNTPPTYGIYIAKLVFEHVKAIGGLKEMEKINVQKADLLYNFLDASKMFKAAVAKGPDRSIMNIPFMTDSEDLDKKFIKEATKAGFVNLKGHRLVGGMRASVYNAMPVEGVKTLVEFMKKFEADNA
ncbi:MAG: 3-phosphoserine/phosphohydroxythreonine transaminase [Spirochaetota bacterium]